MNYPRSVGCGHVSLKGLDDLRADEVVVILRGEEEVGETRLKLKVYARTHLNETVGCVRLGAGHEACLEEQICRRIVNAQLRLATSRVLHLLRVPSQLTNKWQELK